MLRLIAWLGLILTTVTSSSTAHSVETMTIMGSSKPSTESPEMLRISKTDALRVISPTLYRHPVAYQRLGLVFLNEFQLVKLSASIKIAAGDGDSLPVQQVLELIKSAELPRELKNSFITAMIAAAVGSVKPDTKAGSLEDPMRFGRMIFHSPIENSAFGDRLSHDFERSLPIRLSFENPPSSPPDRTVIVACLVLGICRTIWRK